MRYCTVGSEPNRPLLHEAQEASELSTPAPLHPSAARFGELVSELVRLHDRKGRGYGTAADPYANHRRAAEWGTPDWHSTARRIDEKMQRVRGCAKLGAAKSQVDLREELLDVAVLALIAAVIYEDEGP